MGYYILLALIPLGAYAAAGVVAALAVSSARPWLTRHIADRGAAGRARMLALARLLPTAAGAVAALLFATVVLRFEPRATTEAPGAILFLFVLITCVLVLVALARTARSWHASIRCAALLRQCGRVWRRHDGRQVWIVETTYPVAAVTGLFRTRLLLSTRIIHGCLPGELEAVIRHEVAHVRRRDNLVRAAMRCVPDPLLIMNAGRELEAAWAAAAEQAADDEAAGPQADARTELAAALVRVARMVEGPPPRWMPALAFYEGTNLEQRVRQLLATAGASNDIAATPLRAAAVVATAGALLFTETASLQLHALMELAVRHLP
jgi:beta-lactamase regulating signal transducer with metallopeptidase domain